MAHLSGKCKCGRVQHYPKSAKIGDKWTCWSCGRIWTIVKSGGKPLKKIGSKKKKPPKIQKPKKQYRRNNKGKKRVPQKQSNTGCLGIILVLIISIISFAFIY